MAAFATPLLVIALIVGSGVTLWQRGELNRFICDGDCGPAYVIAPAELSIDTTPTRAPASEPQPDPIDPAKLAAAVAPGLKEGVLGPHVGFTAISPKDGSVLASSGSGTFAPASTTKVLTAFAALATLDPGTRWATRSVLTGDRVVLVGGGDPYLSTKPARARDDRVFQADLTTLAARTAAALKKSGRTKVSLGYDASLFSGPDVSPAWLDSYLTENIVTPISALWADQGVVDGLRAKNPAAVAAGSFKRLLAARGIDVTGEPSSSSAPADAMKLAEVRSATVGQIVETLMRTSDNQAAEVVFRHIALVDGGPATFAGGAKTVRAALSAAGIDVTGLKIDDGSGLARGNRISPTTLVETIAAAGATSRTSGLAADLPVSGFTGTLIERFGGLDTALGTVRAKTGTLRGIHSLAGYAIDRDGRQVLFAVMADRADQGRPLEARAALDRVAAAIASCSCG